MNRLRLTPSSRGAWGASLALAAAIITACSDRPADQSPVGPPALAKAAGGSGGGGGKLAVTAADPDTVPRGTTLTITVYGSGFSPGAEVNYLRNGTKVGTVVAEEVVWVSSSELRTRTRVDAGAAPGSYDIDVMSSGKHGIGVEMLEVTVRAEALPDLGYGSEAYGVNEAGVVVGIASDANGYWRAVRWSNPAGAWVAEDLGAGSAYGVNESGEVVGVSSIPGAPPCAGACTAPTQYVWVRLPDGTAVNLGPGGVTVFGPISDNGSVVGWFVDAANSLVGHVRRRIPGTNAWAVPELLPSLAGYSVHEADAIAPDGMRVLGLLLQDGTSGSSQVLRAVSWQWQGTGWGTPVFVDAGGAMQQTIPHGATNAGLVVGRERWLCSTIYCSNAVYWQGTGTTAQHLAGCATSTPDQPLAWLVAATESGALVGACSYAQRKGRKIFYILGHYYWASPTATAVFLSSGSGYRARAVNDAGLVVGKSEQRGNSALVATVWYVK